jgi:hypothetical protein
MGGRFDQQEQLENPSNECNKLAQKPNLKHCQQTEFRKHPLTFWTKESLP